MLNEINKLFEFVKDKISERQMIYNKMRLCRWF